VVFLPWHEQREKGLQLPIFIVKVIRTLSDSQSFI